MRAAGGRARWNPRLLLIPIAAALALAGVAQAAVGLIPALERTAVHDLSTEASRPDGLGATIGQVRLIDHEGHEQGHGGETSTDSAGGGYQMPLSMMPGMPPDGHLRLSVAVSLTNRGEDGRSVAPAGEFVLRDARGDDSWRPTSDTFDGLTRLGPASGASGTLFFDVPEETIDQGQLYIDWEHSGDSLQLAVPLNGSGDSHPHS